jgi:hypothetical protein
MKAVVAGDATRVQELTAQIDRAAAAQIAMLRRLMG